MKRIAGSAKARQVLLALERERRRIARKRAREARAEQAATQRSPRQSRRKLPKSVLEFTQHARHRTIRVRGDTAVIIAPPVFSYLDNPQAALETAEKFARAIRDDHRRIHFDQSGAVAFDLCALTVVDAIAHDAKEERGIGFGGHAPQNEELREIIWATGLPQTLSLTEPPDHYKVLGLIKSSGRGIQGKSSSQPEEYAQKITEYFKSCFLEYNYTLSDKAQKLLLDGLGEILGNAAEYSGGRRWYAKAYLRRPANKSYGDCHLVVFNFGPTISETLQRLRLGSPLRDMVEKIVQKHRGPKLKRHFTDEALWTILALQGGVSNKNSDPSEPESHRGTGTVDMIQMFQDLGQTVGGAESPKMAIVSGRTHIVLDGTYRMAEVTNSEGDRWQHLAFNPSNDIWLPPDRAVVQRLKSPFPGTLISMRFYLDSKYLARAGGHYGSLR